MMARNRGFTLILLSAVVVFSATSVKGQVEVQIVGGHNASAGEVPFIGYLYISIPPDTILCGGTLIRYDLILTAAHCFDDSGKINTSVWGDILRSERSSTHQSIAHKQEDVIIHEKYNPDTNDYDIALIRLSHPLTKTEGVSTIAIASSSNAADFSSCHIAGWGQYGKNTGASDELQIAKTDIVATLDCKDADYFEDRIVCAKYKKTDSCQGDSGGPLYCDNTKTNRRELVGVVSRSVNGMEDCKEGQPGIYTKVSYYSSWIETNGASLTLSASKVHILTFAVIIAAMIF